MAANVDLDTLFPTEVKHARRTVRQRVSALPMEHHHKMQHFTDADPIKTRWATICALELRGMDKQSIADQIGLAYGTVIGITNNPRYLAYRDEHLAKLDNDFLALKPLAINALRNGLLTNDRNTALRASEQWFKGAAYGGFSKTEQPSRAVTAEDVAAQLLQQHVQVNVQVNVSKEGEVVNVGDETGV